VLQKAEGGSDERADLALVVCGVSLYLALQALA
jgi:hypothetical protein